MRLFNRSVVWILHCRLCYLFLLFCVATGTIILGPNFTETTTGRTVRFRCVTDIVGDTFDAVEWRYRRDPKSDFKLIYKKGNIFKGFYGRFTVEGTPSRGIYELVIEIVSPGDAGSYICADIDNYREEGELVVFDVYPSDSSCTKELPEGPVIGSNPIGLAPDVIRLSCKMKYHGNIIALLVWSRSSGQGVTAGVNETSINGVTESTLVIEVDKIEDNDTFTCKVLYLSNSIFSVYSWKTTTSTLSFSNETKLVISSCYEESLDCPLDYNSNCSYSWRSKTGDHFNGSILSIEGKQDGEYSCVASCHIRGINYERTKMTVEIHCNNVTDALKAGMIFSTIAATAIAIGVIVCTGLHMRKNIRIRKSRYYCKSDPEETKALLGLRNCLSSAQLRIEVSGVHDEIQKMMQFRMSHKVDRRTKAVLGSILGYRSDGWSTGKEPIYVNPANLNLRGIRDNTKFYSNLEFAELFLSCSHYCSPWSSITISTKPTYPVALSSIEKTSPDNDSGYWKATLQTYTDASLLLEESLDEREVIKGSCEVYDRSRPTTKAKIAALVTIGMNREFRLQSRFQKYLDSFR